MSDQLILCDNVSLTLPVRNTKPNYAAKAIASAFTGGILKGNSRSASISALSNITLEIKEGRERDALIGHNGAGKTSFLRLISGIFAPTEGNLFIKNMQHLL